MSTNNVTIYINAQQNIEMQSEDVYVKDIGKLTCSDEHVLAKVKAIKLHHFKKDEPKRQVISLLKVIEEIDKVCPGASVESIGEPDVMVEYINVNKHKGPLQMIKLIFVAMISFFGTAFTIMAFHNDIIVFFNHIGGRRITKDPTPIEVEMRIYEEDVNKALIATADREGKTMDVQ